MKTKTTIKTSVLIFAFLALILFGATIGTAAPGDLDPTFGNGGIVISSGGGLIILRLAEATAIQSDGKIVVVGSGATVDGEIILDFAICRYNTNGSPDTSFGSNGIVLTQVSNGDDIAYSVAIQADGKIVVTGLTAVGGFAVVRYNPNGSLDTTFNGTGIVITPVDGANGIARSVAIQTDGKIVVAGISSTSRFALVRYNTNGSLDTSFDNDGIVTNFGGVAYTVAIQADGKIVAGGYFSGSLAIVRYNADGSPDTTFNGTGIVTTPGSGIGGSSMAIQADGKILIAEINRLVRYNANGTPDTSFNGTGIVAPGIVVNSAVVQADGKIVAAGYVESNGEADFAAARFNPNGSPDTTFDFDGIVTTPVYVNIADFATAVAIQADGKIVLVGTGFALVRYQGGSTTNIRTRFDFDGDGRADVSVFRPSDGVWYLNQSTNGFSATQFGLSIDKPTPADFDGDGKTDIAVFRDGTWYLLRSTAGFLAVQFGQVNDVPQPADFNGDGRAELAVYRDGNYFTLNLANNQINTVQFGISSDKPVVGDYDGDGRADYAVYRAGTWYLLRSTQGFTSIQFGLSTDRVVPADYDGDGKTDPAVYRDGTWYVFGSQTGFTTFQFGLASDIPAPADYDGDGRTDAAVFRDGVWHLKHTTASTSSVQFGIQGDLPVPSALVH